MCVTKIIVFNQLADVDIISVSLSLKGAFSLKGGFMKFNVKQICSQISGSVNIYKSDKNENTRHITACAKRIYGTLCLVVEWHDRQDYNSKSDAISIIEHYLTYDRKFEHGLKELTSVYVVPYWYKADYTAYDVNKLKNLLSDDDIELLYANLAKRNKRNKEKEKNESLGMRLVRARNGEYEWVERERAVGAGRKSQNLTLDEKRENHIEAQQRWRSKNRLRDLEAQRRRRQKARAERTESQAAE